MKKLTILLFSIVIMPFMAHATNMTGFVDMMKNKKEQLTLLQFREYMPTLKGAKIDWSSKVRNVWHNGNKYVVELKTTPGIEIYFTHTITNKESALKLNKGEEYIFSGEVERCTTIDSNAIKCNVNIIGFKSRL